MKAKIVGEDREKLGTAVKDGLAWLEEHPSDTKVAHPAQPSPAQLGLPRLSPPLSCIPVSTRTH